MIWVDHLKGGLSEFIEVQERDDCLEATDDVDILLDVLLNRPER